MKRLGIVPPFSVYNTLMDLYGKRGDVDNMIKVKDEMESQGMDPGM